MYKFQPKDFQEISTAYHEATHALFVMLSLFKIEKVEIFSDKKNKENFEPCGLTSFLSPLQYTQCPMLERSFAISEIIVNYSGVVGEQYLFKEISGLRKAPGYIKNGGYYDNKNCKKLFKKYLSNHKISVTDFKRNAYKKIESVLKIYWEDVKIIAADLLKNRCLNYKRLKSELIKKSKNKNYWKNKFKVIDYIFGRKNILIKDSSLRAIIQIQEKLW